MNYNQNKKLMQITPNTLVVGIDIAKDKHVARAQDDRGVEFGKRLIFENRIHGFQSLLDWAERHKKQNKKNYILFGVEPTGHYWLNLAYFLKAKGYDIVVVNPMHVKKSKELDDNSPTKNDTKDAKVIAQLMSTEGRIQNLIQRYFPEFFDVFKDWEGKAALCTLKLFPFPSQITNLTPEEVLAKWKPYVQRGVGIKRATKLVEKAQKSIGMKVGIQFAEQEMQCLLEQYILYKNQIEKLDQEIELLVNQIPGAEEMMNIQGLGTITVALFFAEVGDITKYSHPQQLVNLAGLSLREHSSGKFKGQTRISKRGRSRLRRALYLAIRPLVAHNATFKTLHHYYTNRPERPLKKQQSLIALCCKLLRVLFVIGNKQCEFDGSKLLQGLPQVDALQVA